MKSIAFLLASSVVLSSSTQPAQQEFVEAKTCWKVTTKSCTSCSPQSYDDDECKKDNNGPYSGCIDDENNCDNGARCDADQGTGEC